MAVEVRTDYPGVLASFAMEDGSLVEDGERIADVELMKTFFTIVAPVGGIVRFRIELGEVVAEGDIIAVIED